MNLDRDLTILKDIARYRVMSRAQVQKRHFGKNPGQERLCRKRLEYLAGEGLLGVTRLKYSETSALHAYFPSQKGCDLLWQYTGDESYRAVNTRPPQQVYLLHWLRLTDTHLLLDDALALQREVSLLRWISEYDTVNTDEALGGGKRFTLYAELQKQPRIVCKPDAAFLLDVAGYKRVLYVEEDRDTDSAVRYVAEKVKGYAELHRQRGHTKHFPQTTMNDFSVLMFSPHAGRRDALCKAMRGQPGADLWRFCAKTELTKETFLFEPVFRKADGTPAVLVRRRGTEPPTEAGPLRNGGACNASS